MTLFGNIRQYDEMEGYRLIGKEKKTPDLPFSLPQCLGPAAVTGTAVVYLVAVKSLTMRLTNFYDAHFKKGPPTCGDRSQRRAADEQECTAAG
jgi:hypothetical protein